MGKILIFTENEMWIKWKTFYFQLFFYSFLIVHVAPLLTILEPTVANNK